MHDKIRVVIVDDHQVIRQAWTLLFDTDKRFHVVAAIATAREAVDSMTSLRPDVVLMDINMYPMNGFEATRLILEADPSRLIIGISANNYPGYAQKMLELGARGFVTKSSPFDEITTAVVEVREGRTYVCQEIRKTLSSPNG